MLLIDNSMSMSCQTLEGTWLDIAKQQAIEFTQRLPAGSRVTVAPICGSAEGLGLDAFQSIEHAEDAIRRIQLSGRVADTTLALNLARQAWQVEPELAKRLVLLTDMQDVNWKRGAKWDEDKPVQVVTVRPSPVDNVWVEKVTIQDNLADIETPATILATIRHLGDKPRTQVQATLKVDGQVAGVQTVDLAPNSTREIAYQHLFNRVRPEPGRPQDTLLEVSVPPDRFAADDRRHHVAHVVAALPVVFIDAWGDQESVARGRIGETRTLRKLLSPDASDSSLIQVRHLRPDEVDRDELADARLVVVAGIESPGTWCDVLLDYAQQGGQVLIAAGGDFSPERWNTIWQQGNHLLPAPLLPELAGSLPTDANEQLNPFFLEYESLRSHSYFQIAGAAENDLRDLYSEPLFFQAVGVDESALATGAKNAKTDSATGTDAANSDTPQIVSPSADTPRWLSWAPPASEPTDSTGQVLARFDRDRMPFLIERRVALGRVIFVTTGLQAEWNTLSRTNAILMMDRILRSMIDSTLPQRNYLAQDRISLPLPGGSSVRDVRWELERPTESGDPEIESLEPGFVGSNIRGLTIERPLTPGNYHVRTVAPDGAIRASAPIAVACPAEESELSAADVNKTAEVVGPHVRFLAADERISMSGVQTSGRDLWWWLVLVGFGLLLLELFILAPRRAPPGGLPSTGATA